MKASAVRHGEDQISLEPLEPRLLMSNSAPVAAPLAKSMSASTVLSSAVKATDANKDPLAYSVLSLPTHGTVTMKSTGAFTYTPTKGYIGSDTFTFKANDGHVDSAPATVSIKVGRVVTLTTAKAVKFTDTTGDSMTITLKGIGSGKLYFASTSSKCDLAEVALLNTTTASTLTLSPAVSGKTTTIGELLVNGGSLGTLTATTTDFVGAGIVVSGTGIIKSMTVRDLRNGAGIDMSDSASTITKIQAGKLFAGADITAASTIQTLTLLSWIDGLLNGTTVTSFSVNGSSSRSITGNLGADVTLTGQNAGGVSLGTLTVASTITGSTIRTAGSITTVSAGASSASDFLVGVGPAVVRHAAAYDDFVNGAASIGSFTIKGTTAGSKSRFFTDSNISAPKLGTVNLLNIDAPTVGVYVRQASDAIGSITSKDNDSTKASNKWTWGSASQSAPPAIVDLLQGPPEMSVAGNGSLIPAGDTTPSDADWTDFGSVVQQTQTGPIRTFTVRNTGNGELDATLEVPAGFTVVEGLSAAIPLGGSDTFTIKMNAATAGTVSGDVVITSNDPNHPSYSFTVSGQVTAPDPHSLFVWTVASQVADGQYTVDIYAQMLGADSGDAFSDMSITLYTPGTVNVSTPLAAGNGTSVDTTFGPRLPGDTQQFPATLADYDGDGDNDAVEMDIGILNLHSNFGQTAVLLGTETWTITSGSGPVTLAVYVSPDSRYIDSSASTRVDYSSVYGLGTIVIG